ncbi:MAG TPA: phage tail protein [Candidatus Desulfovibrio gallistercoris]|nr:phage tail protein [Candidatus Desulfovibrio gallistercoris]
MRVDYILPDGTIQETIELADGLTLEQAARTLCPDTGGKFPSPVIALVGDTPAVRELGDWEYPLFGAQVQFRALAMGGGGGGSNPLQMVMQIAIIALAATAAAFTGGTALFGIAGLGLGLGTLAGGLAGTAVMLLGTMLMGALFQQKTPSGQLGAFDAAQASPTYSINASGNQIRMYQVEPECFGRMKIVNDFVANTWTQYIGNEQYGYFVYGIGRGRYDIESLQFGETVFWRNGEFVADTGYEIQDLAFVEPGGKVTIFPDNVVTSDEVSGQEIFAPNDEEFSGAIGPYTTNPPGTETNKLLFDFVFQQGIGRYNDQGKLGNYSVSWRIEYRSVDDLGNGTSEWATLADLSYSDPAGKGTPTPQRLTYTYDVTPARYQVRVVRTSDTTGDGKTLDSLVWGALRAMLPGTYTYPISCIALSIKATNALTQSASQQFSSIVTRKLPLYDRATKTWSEEVPTRSWAAAVSSVCRSQWGGRLADSSIDLDTLWAIDERLQAKGWHYDAYIDGAYLVWTLLNEMCQSQCVIPRLVGPVLSFVEDRANRPATFSLTPRNIVRNTFGVTYVTWSDETPDDVTIEYLDADAGFQQRDVTATLPESESEEPASLSILGITNRDHAHDVAVAYAAHNRWQRVVVECQTEALGRLINKGDICTVAHPRFRNTAAGAVKGWDEKTLSLDLALDMGRLYPEGYEGDVYISLSKPDGGIWGPCRIEAAKPTARTVRFDAGDYSTLTLQSQDFPFSWLRDGYDGGLPTAWTAYTAREYQRRMVVDEVTSSDGLRYNLRLLNDDARIYQYDDLPTPPWQGRGQLPTVDTLSAPQNFRGVIQSETSVQLVWAGVSGAEWYDVEISATGTAWANVGQARLTQMVVSVSPGKVFARVRAASSILTGPWSTWKGDSTIPAPTAPVVTAGEYTSGSAPVEWDAVENALRYSVSLQSGGSTFYSATTTVTTLAVTPELQTGGPYRELTVSVAAVGENGTSDAGVAKLSDPAPEAPTDAVISIGEDSITLESVTPDEAADRTGYVIVRGDTADFGLSQVVELRQTASLPYIWGGLSAGTYFFRVAVKDGFYDVGRNPAALNWSAVLTVEVAGE